MPYPAIRSTIGPATSRVDRRGVRELIVPADEDERQPQHRGEIRPFVKLPVASVPFAEERHRDPRLPAHRERERGAGRHGDAGADEVGVEENARSQAADMQVALPAPRRRARAAQEVREVVPEGHPEDQPGAEIAVQGRRDVVGAEREGGPDRGRLVPVAGETGAHDRAPAVERDDALLRETLQQHVPVEIAQIVGAEPRHRHGRPLGSGRSARVYQPP